MSLVFFLLAIFSVFFYYYYNKDIFHPGSIFLFFWFFTCGLSCIDYNDFMNPWCVEMYVVTIISGLSFWIGTFVFLKKRDFKKFKPIKLGKEFNIILYVLFFFCFSAMLTEWVNGGMHLNLFETSEGVFDQKNEIDGDIGGLHYGTIFLPFLAILFYYKVLNSSNTFKSDFIIIFIIIMSSIFIKLSRGDLLIYILSFIFLYSRYYRLNIKLLILSIFIIVFMFLGIMSFRVSNTSIVFSTTSNPYISVFYSYIATCFANLNDYIIINDNYHFFGNATLSPIWTLTGMKDILQVNQTSQIDTFNASVYLYDFYHDYKLIGVVFFPFLLGIILSKIYFNILFKNSLWVILLASLQKAIYVSFFGNYFFGELVLLFPYILIYLIIIFQFSITDIRLYFRV